MLYLYYLFFGNGSKIKYRYKSGFYFTFLALSQILTFQISHLRCTLIVICAIESVQSVDNQFRERKTSGLAKKTELHSISLFYYLQRSSEAKKGRGRTKFSQMKTYYTTILVGHFALCKNSQKMVIKVEEFFFVK